MLILSPSCFTVCGHHLSPRIAIVFSLLSSLPNSSMSRTSNFLISSNAFRSSLVIGQGEGRGGRSHCFSRAMVAILPATSLKRKLTPPPFPPPALHPAVTAVTIAAADAAAATSAFALSCSLSVFCLNMVGVFLSRSFLFVCLGVGVGCRRCGCLLPVYR